MIFILEHQILCKQTVSASYCQQGSRSEYTIADRTRIELGESVYISRREI